MTLNDFIVWWALLLSGFIIGWCLCCIFIINKRGDDEE